MSGPVDDLVDEALTEFMRRHARRLERELVGAWRAGYEYVYVATEPTTLSTAFEPDEAGDAAIRIDRTFVPTHEQVSGDTFDDRLTVTEYHVGDLDAEQVREVRA
ncbi:hypothetical protein HrrHc1_015 [Halorubrum phage Hardycor1]|nr:hypothetical protein HrrHc1_015 [Halorubrum phage Hardycor1]